MNARSAASAYSGEESKSDHEPGHFGGQTAYVPLMADNKVRDNSPNNRSSGSSEGQQPSGKRKKKKKPKPAALMIESSEF